MLRPLFFILLLISCSAYGQVRDTALGKPICWYYVSDPWATFIGAEGPLFVLYNTGNILFWKNHAYRLTKVDEQGKNELIDELGLKDTLFEKSRHFDATSPYPTDVIGATDNPTYTVFVNLDTLVRISVYGHITSKEYRRRFPSQFLRLYRFIMNFYDAQATTWLPDKIEILLSSYNHSPDVPIQWPAGWPDLNSPDTRIREGYSTSIFLEKKYFPKLLQMLKQRKEKQAFEINGEKFFVGYRLPVPGIY